MERLHHRAYPSPSRCSRRARFRSCACLEWEANTRNLPLTRLLAPFPRLCQGRRLGVRLLSVLPAATQAPGTAHCMAQLHGLGLLPRLSCCKRLPRPDSRRQSQRVEFARLCLPFFRYPGGLRSRAAAAAGAAAWRFHPLCLMLQYFALAAELYYLALSLECVARHLLSRSHTIALTPLPLPPAASSSASATPSPTTRATWLSTTPL